MSAATRSEGLGAFVDALGARRQLRGMRLWHFVALASFCVLPASARADAVRLDALPRVHEACLSARQRTRPRLYVMDVEPGWRFGRRHTNAGVLPIDNQRNLVALDGRVSILFSGLETVTFEAASEEAAQALRDAARAGARLRIGFFLGFDDPGRQPCLVRGAHSITIVRADLAFAELVSSSDERIARSETDRFTAWSDDTDQLAIPGEGPRGAVQHASFVDGTEPPEAWLRALRAASARGAIAQCHAAGIALGASREGEVVVRLNVEARSGRVRRADVALSSIGNTAEAECLARAVGGLSLPPGPPEWRAEVVDVSATVRLTAE